MKTRVCFSSQAEDFAVSRFVLDISFLSRENVFCCIYHRPARNIGQAKAIFRTQRRHSIANGQDSESADSCGLSFWNGKENREEKAIQPKLVELRPTIRKPEHIASRASNNKCRAALLLVHVDVLLYQGNLIGKGAF